MLSRSARSERRSVGVRRGMGEMLAPLLQRRRQWRWRCSRLTGRGDWRLSTSADPGVFPRRAWRRQSAVTGRCNACDAPCCGARDGRECGAEVGGRSMSAGRR